jgi:hypothetical protein
MKAIVQNISIRFRKLCLIVCCILLKNIWKTTTILPRATAPQFVNYTSQYSTANNKLSRRSGKQVSVMLRPLTLEVLPEWICLCSCNYRQGVWVPALKGWACCVGGIARPTLEHCYCLTLLTQDIHLAGVAEKLDYFWGQALCDSSSGGNPGPLGAAPTFSGYKFISSTKSTYEE